MDFKWLTYLWLMSIFEKNCGAVEIEINSTNANSITTLSVLENSLKKVEATIKLAANILQLEDGKIELLRRIAFVESSFGKDEKIMTQNPNGGIWQVRPAAHDYMVNYYDSLNNSQVFNNSLEAVDSAYNKSITMLDTIEKALNDSCFLCTYNYQDPLRSVLAAGIFVELTNAPIESNNLNKQAEWWSGQYHDNGNASLFIEKSLNLATKYGHTRALKADIWFIFDNSLDVINDDYDQARCFVTSILSDFKLSVSEVQLAFSTYILDHVVHLWFSNSSSIDDFESKLIKIQNPASSKTGEAIGKIISEAFNVSNRERYRVMFILANKNNQEDMTETVNDLRRSKIVTVAVSVGGGQGFKKRFAEIDSDRKDIHAEIYSSFDELLEKSMDLSVYICKTLLAQKITDDLEIFMIENSDSNSTLQDVDSAIKQKHNLECFLCKDQTSDNISRIIEGLLDGSRFFNETKDQLKTLLKEWAEVHAITDNCSSWQIDLWFLCEDAATYSNTDFQKALSFIRNVSSNFFISADKVRVGISLAYGNKHEWLLQFNESSNLSNVYSVASNAKIPYVPVNSGNSLEEVVEFGFSYKAGSRYNEKDVASFIIRITNRRSEDNITEAFEQAGKRDITLINIAIGNLGNSSQLSVMNLKRQNQYTFRLLRYMDIPVLKNYIHPIVYITMRKRGHNLIPTIWANTKVSLSIPNGRKLNAISVVHEDRYFYMKFLSGNVANGENHYPVLLKKPPVDYESPFKDRELDGNLNPQVIFLRQPYLLGWDSNDTMYQVFFSIENTGETDLWLSINTSSGFVELKPTLKPFLTAFPEKQVPNTPFDWSLKPNPNFPAIPVFIALVIVASIGTYFAYLKENFHKRNVIEPIKQFTMNINYRKLLQDRLMLKRVSEVSEESEASEDIGKSRDARSLTERVVSYALEEVQESIEDLELARTTRGKSLTVDFAFISDEEKLKHQKELKRHLEFLLQHHAGKEELAQAFKAYEASLIDPETKNLLSKAKREIVYKSIRELNSLLFRAIVIRDAKELKAALLEVEKALKSQMTESEIKNDVELNENIKKALEINKKLDLLEEMKEYSLHMLKSTFSNESNYLNFKEPMQKVIEAIYVLLGKVTEPGHETERIAYMLSRDGENLATRLQQSRISDITVQQAQHANFVLESSIFVLAEDMKDNTVAYLRNWLLSMIEEVECRSAGEEKPGARKIWVSVENFWRRYN